MNDEPKQVTNKLGSTILTEMLHVCLLGFPNFSLRVNSTPYFAAGDGKIYIVPLPAPTESRSKFGRQIPKTTRTQLARADL